MQKLKKTKNKKTWKRLQSLADSGDKTNSSGIFQRPYFPKHFLLQTQKCLETCICVTKWVKSKTYAMKVRILQTIFFQSSFRYNLCHFSTILRPRYHTSFFLNIFVFFSKLQDVYKHVYLASQIVQCQNGRRSNFYMVEWTLMYSLVDIPNAKTF